MAWSAPTHYLNQRFLVYWRMHASLGLSELMHIMSSKPIAHRNNCVNKQIEIYVMKTFLSSQKSHLKNHYYTVFKSSQNPIEKFQWSPTLVSCIAGNRLHMALSFQKSRIGASWKLNCPLWAEHAEAYDLRYIEVIRMGVMEAMLLHVKCSLMF